MTTDEVVLNQVANRLGTETVNNIILQAQLEEAKREANALHVENVALHEQVANAKAEIERLSQIIHEKPKAVE